MGPATQPALLDTPDPVADPTVDCPADCPAAADPFAAAAATLRSSRRPVRRRRVAPAPVAAITAIPERPVAAPTMKVDAAVGTLDPSARLAAAVAAVIAPLGVPDSDRRDSVVAAVTEFLAGRHIDAEVASLRYGVLTLSTDPALVSFVRCDATEIAEVCAEAGLELRDVRVRTRR